MKQIKGKQGGKETNDSSASTVKEGIVQKLQGVLFAVRRDRDREHRSRDIAMEKLRSAKEIYETDKSNFEAEKEKLAKTQEEAEKTQHEILKKEKTVGELQQKVREAKRCDVFLFEGGFLTFVSLCISRPQYQFQHEDLLRKRQKIQQQESSQESTASKRNEIMIDVRKRLDRQRNKYQEIKETEGRESENLLVTMVSLAIRKANKTDATAVTNKIEKSEVTDEAIEGTTGQSGETVKAGTLEDGIAIEETLADNRGEDGKAADPEESKLNANGLDQFLDELEAKKEAALTNEFKTNIDYDMLPTMISQKAQDLQTETEKMLAEIARLETLLYGETKFSLQEEENDPQSDIDTIACSESQFEADGETESMRAEVPRLDIKLHEETKPHKGSQNQGQQSDRILNSEITFERNIDGGGKMQSNGAQFDVTEKSNNSHENEHDSDVDTIIGSDIDLDEGLDFANGLDGSFSAFSENAREQGQQSHINTMRGETTQMEALLQAVAKARDLSEGQGDDGSIVGSEMNAKEGLGNSIEKANLAESAVSTGNSMDTN